MRKIDFDLRRDKYNTGGNTDLRSLPPEELDAAFKSISEGNETLEKLLRISFEKGITTMFSCGGHEDSKEGSQICFLMDDEFINKYLPTILSDLGEETGFQIAFSNNGLNRTLNIQTNYRERFSILEKVLTGIMMPKLSPEIPKDFEELYSLSTELETRDFEYSIELAKNRSFNKVQICDGGCTPLFSKLGINGFNWEKIKAKAVKRLTKKPREGSKYSFPDAKKTSNENPFALSPEEQRHFDEEEKRIRSEEPAGKSDVEQAKNIGMYIGD